ncbi:hypothetical protein BUALT_Bualt19G0072400 [Buddleja alternifolia]|uniref:Uncharacterized protein n=1 Tax=Buddleja alternifolia TaxID=168488 RepID=A0AAV6W2G6_9LAMI|nr:hypothetical protein BUALT_Bualt19G0072400 [Buddleja alternifolia]
MNTNDEDELCGSDYDPGDESCDDDILFQRNVDPGLELGDPENINKNENESSSESNFSGEDDVVGSDSDLNEDRVSTDDEEGPNYQTFNWSDHRFCVRHMHNNSKSDGYRGMTFKNALWSAACATNVNEFKLMMAEMKAFDQSAFD